ASLAAVAGTRPGAGLTLCGLASVEFRPFEVTGLRVHDPQFAGGDVEPGATERQAPLALQDLDARKGPEIRDREADRYPLERSLPLARRHQAVAPHGFRRRRNQTHPLADEITGRQRLAVGVERSTD